MMRKELKEKILGIFLFIIALAAVAIEISVTWKIFTNTNYWNPFSISILIVSYIFTIPVILVFAYISYKLLFSSSTTEVNEHYVIKESAKSYRKYLKKHVGVIIFSGMDGCGKTVHSSIIKTFLRNEGVKVGYYWLRWFSFLSTPLLLYAKLIRRSIKINYAGKTRVFHLFAGDSILCSIYPNVLMLDILFKYLFIKFVSLLTRNDVILLDRAFLDVIVDLIYETNNPKILKSLISKTFIAILQRTKTILLVCSPLIAIKRKRRSELLSIRELKYKLNLYLGLSKAIDTGHNIIIIDTSYNDIKETKNLIMKFLKL